MKLKAIVCSAVILASLTGPAVSTVMVANEREENTDVNINFIAGSEITPPVDPDEPKDPSGETGTEQPGPLSMDWVPVFEFGVSHPVSSTQQSYNNTTSRPYIQVTDLRGNGSGWKVTAALSGFTSGGQNSLLGAFITLKNGDALSATSGVAAPTPSDPVILTADGEDERVVTASAATQAGRGTWVIRWYPVGGVSDVNLTVPAAAATTGTHTASITWTLYDAP